MQLLHVLRVLSDFFRARDDIVFAILFGSYARGLENKNSDIDIAILFRKKPSIDDIMNIMFELSAILDVNEDKIDILVLNEDISYSLCFEVLRHGIPIIIKDREAFKDFYTKVVSFYYDLKILSETHNLREMFISKIDAMLQ